MLKAALLFSQVFAMTVLAAPVKQPVKWTVGDTAFEGVVVYDGASKAKRPGLVMVPNWMGVTDAAVKQAELVAKDRYVVLVADVYGATVRPKSPAEAGKAAGAMKADRTTLRTRVNKALEVLQAQPLVDTSRLGAIGFCFGGTTALELARSGAKVAGTVSFHGGLSSPTPKDAKAIVGRVLALHGADDPTVPPEEVQAFETEMRDAKVDWQLVAFGGTVHSFTDPSAKMVGTAQYNEKVARRAYVMMDAFFDELFAARK